MTPTHPIKIVCAWCGIVIAWGEDPVSHGICPECAAWDEIEREGAASVIGFPKPERRQTTKRREKRVHADHVAKVRAYVFGRERSVCRCCRVRVAQSMHEIVSRGAGGKVSRVNSIAVCGQIVGAVPSCHTYLQLREIEVSTFAMIGAEGVLTFIPTTKAAADWMKVKFNERIESAPMIQIEAAE